MDQNADISTNLQHEQQEQYRLLVDSIHASFNGNNHVNKVLTSLHDLFAVFDDANHSTAACSKSDERHLERDMMLGVITMLLNYLIKDQDESIRSQSIDQFIETFRKGIDQSSFVSMLMREFEDVSSLMTSVKLMFEADGVSDDDIDTIVQKIDHFLRSSFTANNSISFFREDASVSGFEENDRKEIERLLNGWVKNENEMRKRTKKLENFRTKSTEKLDTLEKSIEESKERNKEFRKTLNDTSDRIAILIEQLHDNTQKSDFLQKEIKIIDSTVSDLELYKEKTRKEYEELEEQLFEKQNSLVDFLKKIDRNLDDSLHKHQQIIERHDTFNEALEELAECYSSFEEKEHEILQKFDIQPVDLKIDSKQKESAIIDKDAIVFIEKERDEFGKKARMLDSENKALSSDLEDLLCMNTRLTDANKDLKERLEKIDSGNKTRFLEEKDALKNQHLETIDEQKSKIEELIENESLKIGDFSGNNKDYEHLKKRLEEAEHQNEKLRNVNSKTQEIYMENKDLIEENSQLQEDIEKSEASLKVIEAKVQELEVNNSLLEDEKNNLKSEILELDVVKQPRVLKIKTKIADIIALASTTLDEKEEPSLEELLQIERDRNTSLEKMSKKNQASLNTLLTICRKFGLEKLEADIAYSASIDTTDNSQTLHNSGVVVTHREMNVLKARRNKSNLDTQEECIIDELSSMLQESYQHSNQVIEQNKLLQNELSTLQLERNRREKNNVTSSSNTQSHAPTPEKSDVKTFVKLFQEMGISQLQYGCTYSVHYQVLSSKAGSSRRSSYTFQHTVNAVNFDPIKDIMVRMGNSHITPPSPKPMRKISRAPVMESPLKNDIKMSNLQNQEDVKLQNLQNDIELNELTPVIKISSSGSSTARELERLLRIAKRDNEELIKRNRELRNEMRSIKENKERFVEEHRRMSKDEILEGDESNTPMGGAKGVKGLDDDESYQDLQHAYELSDANCTFLEKQNHILADQLQKIEALIDQYKNDIFDQNELLECAKKETQDSGKKAVDLERQTKQLKQDVEYLEGDLEYLKQKLKDTGIETVIPDGKHIRQTGSPDESALRSDFEVLLSEKSSLLLECESLTAKVKFLEAENKFALEEARLIQKHVQSQGLGTESNVPEQDEVGSQSPPQLRREKTNSFIEKEIKSEGLAKRFKALQKDYRHLQKDQQNQVQLRLEAEQRISVSDIEIQALQSSIGELEEKIIIMENRTMSEQNSRDSEEAVVIDLGRRLSNFNEGNILASAMPKEIQFIKEEAILVSQANNEIKQANGMLLRRNSSLRRESLQAVATKKELELLKDRLNSMEIENSVLKMESMKQRGKRNSLTRKLSNTWPEIKLVKTSSKSTQVCLDEPVTNSSNDESSSEADHEELEFMIDDLTRRNSELKAKLFTSEKRASELETENHQLEEINLKVLERNSYLKEQVEQKQETANEKKTQLSDSALSDDVNNMGINLFFKDDILSEYKKAELEEEIKSLKYENQLLKQDLVKKTKDQEELMLQLQQIKQETAQREFYLNENNVLSHHSCNELLPKEESISIANNQAKEVNSKAIKDLKATIKKLELEKETLVKHRFEYVSTIEQLERQLLFNKKTEDSTKDRSFELLEDSQDDLFNQKFLLQSNVPDDKTTFDNENRMVLSLSHNTDNGLLIQHVEGENGDVERSPHSVDNDGKFVGDGSYFVGHDGYGLKNVDNANPNNEFSLQNVEHKNQLVKDYIQPDDDEDDFDIFMKEGELSTEMEDIFRKYTQGEADFVGVVTSETKDDSQQVASVANVEKPVGKAGRFRSKEDLEETVQRQEDELNKLQVELNILESKCTEYETKYRQVSEELEQSNKHLLTSQQSFMELSLSLNERLDEVNHLKSRAEEWNKEEERATNEILSLEEGLKEKDSEYQQLERHVEECRYKMDASAKECDDYRSIVEEQERIMSEAHESNSIMQRNFNDMFREMSEKEDQILIYKEEVAKLSDDLDVSRHEKMENERTIRELQEEIEKMDARCDVLESENRDMRKQICGLESHASNMQKEMVEKDENTSLVIEEQRELHESYAEQEQVIDTLRQQLRDSQEVMTLYAESSSRNDVFDDVIDNEGLGMKTRAVVNCHDISFEIAQASKSGSSKTAREMSFENANITLPEIFIRKNSTEAHEEKCTNCLPRRSNSLPATTAQLSNLQQLFPNKYLVDQKAGLSEVSDIDDMDLTDNAMYTTEYVQRLKTKLKRCSNKVRDRNKIIHNQNEDIDNFLEDIAGKELKILRLRDQVDKLRKQEMTSIEEDLFDVKTPSFSVLSTTSFSGNESLVKELFDLVEECCAEIQNLQSLVKEAPSVAEVQELREKLHVSRDKVNYLRAKLSKCVELGLISASVSREERTYEHCPNMLEIPGKTVNEIKTENELLQIYNNELKKEIEELRHLHGDPPLHSSMCHDHEMEADSIEDLLETEEEHNSKDTELLKDIEKLTQKLQTSESQIEKDWEIIESQGVQLENLHQQFIEQRDENQKHMKMVKLKDDELENLFDDLNKLHKELNDMRMANSRKSSTSSLTSDEENHITKQAIKNQVVHVAVQVDTFFAINEEKRAYYQVVPEVADKNDISKDEQNELKAINVTMDTMDKEQTNKIIEDLRHKLEDRVTSYDELCLIVTAKETVLENLMVESKAEKQKAKRKEEDLEKLLNEKEEGIVNLHLMIRELEESLSNSQVHIEGILKDSIENRESEEAKEHLIQEQENLIQHLKTELQNSSSASRVQWKEAMQLGYNELTKYFENVKMDQMRLRDDVSNILFENAKYTKDAVTQLRDHLKQFTGKDNICAQVTNVYERESECIEENQASNTDFLSPASSDSENLFVPRQSSESFNSSPIPPIAETTLSLTNDFSLWMVKIRKFEREKEELMEKHKELSKRQEIMHKIQIDTVIRSLARRHSRKIRPFLTPSPELFNASTRMGQSEFLKTCINKVKYVDQ